MVDTLRWLALEVKYLDRAQSFYEGFLELDVVGDAEYETVLDAGGTELILRAPGPVPRGGIHTHYAFSIPREAYDSWYSRLDDRFDLVEETFGNDRSLYFYDMEGNCVELGESDVAGPGVGGIFEVVLEVEDLDRAQPFYERLGFGTVDEGDDRERVRMSAGGFDIELWEPHLGLADARGGVHVDMGVGTADAAASVQAVSEEALTTAETDGGYRLRDPDGHYISLLEK